MGEVAINVFLDHIKTEESTCNVKLRQLAACNLNFNVFHYPYKFNLNKYGLHAQLNFMYTWIYG